QPAAGVAIKAFGKGMDLTVRAISSVAEARKIALLCGDPPVRRAYSRRMRRFALMLIIATSLTACADAAIGPVDHSCAANPMKGQGSGCDERGSGGGGGRM
ncbi:MAG TPA: hypothetical protein VHT04_02515, partial [Stellaceae bacterium]|nr:hypothetical protein [Stellaceae bacterium]